MIKTFVFYRADTQYVMYNGLEVIEVKRKSQISILRDEPVTKALMHLAIPAILSSLVMTLHNVIDTIFISQLKDNTMIAATTVALPITLIVYAFGDGLGAGSGSYLGRLLGAKEEKKVTATVATAMTIALILSGISVIISLLGLKPIISLFTNEEQVILHAYDYMQIMMLGSFFVIYKELCSNLLRSTGDAKFPMIMVFVEIIANTLLNPILMFDFGFGLKVKGAALGTVLAQGISCVLLFIRLIHHDELIHWRVGDFRIDKQSVQEIWNVGFAVFIRNGLPSLSYGLFAKSAGLFGTDYLAAAGLARKGEHMANFAIMGMAHGYMPFASFNFGAKNKKRLIEAMKKSILMTTVYGLFMAVCFYVFALPIMRLITPDYNLALIGRDILRGYTFSMPIIGIYQILAGSFQATGKGKLSFFTSICRQGLFYCPLVVILPRLFQKAGFILVQPICDWVSMFLVVILARNLLNEIKQMPE